MNTETAIKIAKARAAKVEAMVGELDELTRRAGHDPVKSAAGIANMLRGWSDLRWRQLAISCGKRPPSEVSKALVIQVYISRCQRADRNRIVASYLDAAEQLGGNQTIAGQEHLIRAGRVAREGESL